MINHVVNEEGYCEVCGEKPVKYKCEVCTRRVCEEHYLVERGMCVICENTLCRICRSYLSIGICKYCGRLGCEKCLIQITPIEYVCVECYRRIGFPGERGENEDR